ncbi:MAG: CHAD domain-containing protein [Steroidobacteraceae bacterium]
MRDAARALSAIPDSKVLLDTLNKLVDRFHATGQLPQMEDLRRSLRRERAAMRRWRTGNGGWEVLGAGLERVYGKGRNALAVAHADRTAAKLHEWRKQTKYLWHQQQLLEPRWPGMIGELADEARKLADYLGDDPDLSVLRDKLIELGETVSESERRALMRLIDAYRTELRDKARVLGYRLFEETPWTSRSASGSTGETGDASARSRHSPVDRAPFRRAGIESDSANGRIGRKEPTRMRQGSP